MLLQILPYVVFGALLGALRVLHIYRKEVKRLRAFDSAVRRDEQIRQQVRDEQLEREFARFDG